MAVSADDDVHAPVGVKQRGELLVLLKADVGEQHGEVDVDGVVGVADVAHLARRLADVYEGADQLVVLRRRQHLLRDDADEEDLHAVDVRDPERPKHPPAVGLDVQVGIDDGKVRALFKEQQMREAVVDLVVADGRHIGAH